MKKNVLDVVGKNTLFEYIRDKETGRRIGILIAFDKNKIGWSLCRQKKAVPIGTPNRVYFENGTMRETIEYRIVNGDKFNFDVAFAKAKHRADNPKDGELIPSFIVDKVEEMIKRAERYYK